MGKIGEAEGTTTKEVADNLAKKDADFLLNLMLLKVYFIGAGD